MSQAVLCPVCKGGERQKMDRIKKLKEILKRPIGMVTIAHEMGHTVACYMQEEDVSNLTYQIYQSFAEGAVPSFGQITGCERQKRLDRGEPKPKPNTGACPNCLWKEGYFVDNKGEICPVCHGTGKAPDESRLLTDDQKCDYLDSMNELFPNLSVKLQSALSNLIDEVAKAQLVKDQAHEERIFEEIEDN